MAEIIYSVISSNEGTINMDVFTDPIIWFNSGEFAFGKTKSGIYFYSAQGCNRKYKKIESLMVLSKWKTKADNTNPNA